MIHVRVGDLTAEATEGILRPVDAGLEAVTAGGRQLELQAGPAMSSRLREVGDLPMGGALITPGGELSCAFVIHAVIRSSEEPVTELSVQRALTNGLRRAEEWGLASLALPPLGVGAGSLDAEGAAGVMVPVLRDHVGAGSSLQEVVIVVANEYEADAFDRALERTFRSVAGEGS